jgi:hypothetical protein
MALARKRLAFSTLKLVLRSSRYHRAARRCSCARERFAWVTLKYAPLLENALRSSSLIPRHSCNSLALIVALACNSPVHTHRALIVPHRRSSYHKHRAFIDAKAGELLALARPHAHARERLAFIVAHACKSSALIVPVIVAHSRKVRGLITLKLRNVLRLTMLIATVRIPTTYPHLRV